MAITSQTTSEGIKTAMEAITATSGAYDTFPQAFHPYYDGSDVYLLMQTIEIGVPYGVSHANPPKHMKDNFTDLARAWSKEEVEAWIGGCALFTPSFTYEAGTPSGRKCTIEIDTGSWEGTDVLGSDDEAAGLAFIELLEDANYTDFCTVD